MTGEPYIQPLPYKRRKHAFLFLFGLFIITIPILYLYATGYRFDFTERGNLISTGGMFIAAERTGAAIFIDGELVRETRVFRRAFYAQSLEPGTHRVHVQKDGHHTWVKELPVYPHLVTEAQAFNLPLVPTGRVIAKWQATNGAAVVGTSTLLATTTQPLSFATQVSTSTHLENPEYAVRHRLFVKEDPVAVTAPVGRLAPRALNQTMLATTTDDDETLATTTKEWRNVRLYEQGEDTYARWVGSRDNMPYYYCAEEFELIGTSTVRFPAGETQAGIIELARDDEVIELLDPIQQIDDDVECIPDIRIDRRGEVVRGFDFFPGSVDLVLMTLESGIYVVEIDDRAWQNVQPLMLGEHLAAAIENGRIYVYDGTLIYEMVLE